MRRTALATVILLATPLCARGQELQTLQRGDGASLRARVYRPDAACRGIAVLSHGAGGSEDGLAYLGRAMAGDGYLSVVVGHRESGRQALRREIVTRGVRRGLTELVADTAAYTGRLMDVAAARTWAAAQCAGREAVLLGHSMGAATVMIEAGARNGVGARGADAFDAYVALSPQGTGTLFPSGAWSGIRKPVLSITGTRDAPLNGGSYRSRTEPFDGMSAGCKWLAVIDGATHMDFGGRGGAPLVESLTTRTVHAFLTGARFGTCQPPAPERGIEIQTK